MKPEKLSKSDARIRVQRLQEEIHRLEQVINERALRPFVDFAEWRQDQLSALEKQQSEMHLEVDRLTRDRNVVLAERDALSREVVSLRDAREFQDVGFFEYEHPAEDSTALASELEEVRSQIKLAIRNQQASTSAPGFTFNNSAAEGKRFVAAMTKLLLRAYNAEAENAVKTTKAGNLATARARLTKAAEQIAKNGSMIQMQITGHFHSLRLAEIELAHRHLRAVRREKELERERKAELREQRRVELELKKEQERLQKEKSHYETTLAALRNNGDESGIERVLTKLEDVSRAIQDVDYRAANIRAGYVYVVSNVGSFGPGVVKIGMTRRLDPMDRVRELGDASVPFNFDVHALFFADDAVSVENMLHKEFSHRRLNQVNLRREYFETTPEKVLAVLKQHDVEVLEFIVESSAEEYVASQTIRDELARQA